MNKSLLCGGCWCGGQWEGILGSVGSDRYQWGQYRRNRHFWQPIESAGDKHIKRHRKRSAEGMGSGLTWRLATMSSRNTARQGAWWMPAIYKANWYTLEVSWAWGYRYHDQNSDNYPSKSPYWQVQSQIIYFFFIQDRKREKEGRMNRSSGSCSRTNRGGRLHVSFHQGDINDALESIRRNGQASQDIKSPCARGRLDQIIQRICRIK